MKFAHYISETEVSYPDYSQPPFASQFNVLENCKLHADNGFYPLSGAAHTPPTGGSSVPSSFQLHDNHVPREELIQMFIQDEEGETVETFVPSAVIDDKSWIEITGWRDILPEDDTSRRDATEFAIVSLIVDLAVKYNAVQDLLAIEDFTIPALQNLALVKGVTSSDWSELICGITPLKWELEAVTAQLWADCWAGLKSRFPSYIAQRLAASL